MNEWLAFGIVAVICGLLGALMRWTDHDGPDPAEDTRDDGPA
jgi:hypothetical protein